MIGRLTGRVVAQEFDGTLIFDVSGVGYELAAPLGTLGRARPDESGRVTLWVHTHVRQDTLCLFGFSDETERAAFRTLLGVSNVGPKIAVAILGALPAADLANAIATRNLGALTAVSGIGRKIAERLLLELRDKLSVGVAKGAAGVHVPDSTAMGANGSDGRLRATLLGMGFRPAEVERAIDAMPSNIEDPPLATRLRDALALLVK
jgi:Holliday junction DNA helicase RuvA